MPRGVALAPPSTAEAAAGATSEAEVKREEEGVRASEAKMRDEEARAAEEREREEEIIFLARDNLARMRKASKDEASHSAVQQHASPSKASTGRASLFELPDSDGDGKLTRERDNTSFDINDDEKDVFNTRKELVAASARIAAEEEAARRKLRVDAKVAEMRQQLAARIAADEAAARKAAEDRAAQRHAASVAAEEKASKRGAPEGGAPVRCPVCSKEFALEIALSTHLRDKQDVRHQQFRSDPGSCETRGHEQVAAGAVRIVVTKEARGAGRAAAASGAGAPGVSGGGVECGKNAATGGDTDMATKRKIVISKEAGGAGACRPMEKLACEHFTPSDAGELVGVSHSAGASAALPANAAAAILALRDLAHRFRGRVWPNTKAQVKSEIASLHRDEPAWLREWIPQADQLVDFSPEKQIKNMVKIFLDQWRNRLGVLSGPKTNYAWNKTTIDQLLRNKTTIDQLLGKRTQRARMGEQGSPAETVRPEEATSQTASYRLATGENVELVQSLERFEQLLASDATLCGETDSVVALDCKGVPEALHLIQLATKERVVVLDGIKLGQKEMCALLAPLLTSKRTVKLLHDLHKDAAALASIGGVEMSNCLDSQLIMELISHSLNMGFNEMLKQLGGTVHPSKLAMKDRMTSDSSKSIFLQRPLPRDVIEYAVMDVTLLLSVHERLVEMLEQDQLARIMLASGTRAHYAGLSGGKRRVCVDDKYVLSSRELMEAFKPALIPPSTPLEVINEIEPLISLLPADVAAGLSGHEHEVSDIQLDKGRRPLAWCAGKRVFLGSEDRVITIDEIDGIVSHLGGFGGDNRAGLEAQLHRISAIRNRARDVIGLTLRVGRHVGGNAAMIRDLLFREDASILFLGEPGSGKTTIVREATRLLAEMSNVLIVDTSNEIAGDGDVPHHCVGLARRLQVCSLDEQSSTMIEGVQNHTPEVMVIDEIGRPAEVEAARTCKARGVRMIASAHGDLRKLLKNKQLRGLVGGVESVTLGDAAAKDDAKRRGAPVGAMDKVKPQRSGPPIFDVIVELRRGEPHEWRIVVNSARAVDQILEGDHYYSERRTRDPDTGEFFLELERA
jgi:stage III sporulation protein SpoIIIAA